ncbi:hypothetical protein [Anaerotignum sp. MB30-C6]|uniref:hypothetical protein n=1 Tax=Anaerotignum sp. MB30-C6 TaxID=3070814 RepID=UPI0027DC2409|nr:hypothetical protein [Anaerotignum sp. MB30-C6]WMI80912.1 hypothetical protein RBQ60_13995 [Anaerotignum sp. MB30-C6]
MKKKKIKEFMRKFSAEILLLIGISFLCIATARIDITLMLYLIGVSFFASGIFIAKNRGDND